MEAKQRFGIRLFAYAFLHNHYHFLIQEPSTATLSEAMRWFNGSVAARYNLRHGLCGHLWQGRFKSRPIRDDQDVLQCMVYIDLNAARAGLTPSVTDWPFASAKAHAEGLRDPLLDEAPVPIPAYKELLFSEWRRTTQLQRAIRVRDREAIKRWLRHAPARALIPYHREITQLVGHNFRRLIPR